MDKSKLKRRWLITSAVGLALFGLGLSLVGEALIKKYEAEHWNDWFWFGTMALIVTNSGLAIFGKAITLRVKLDQPKQ